eukprot:3119295-Alexandrium_andersonii.AAC.1
MSVSRYMRAGKACIADLQRVRDDSALPTVLCPWPLIESRKYARVSATRSEAGQRDHRWCRRVPQLSLIHI